MKRFALASTLALGLSLGTFSGTAGAAPDCNTTKTCEVERAVEQVLCLGNMDCPQRAARD
jgi:hypothetical protein